ncbi:MAG TPA: alkene reductase [Vineibacter sp.]|nr:alkene reductase [Vineibacter sp.]
MISVWDPVTVGRIDLPHRFAMSPMTRSRAEDDGTPGDLAAEYYSQRAALGLLITEGTQPSADGQGYLNTPGIYTDRHVAGWRRVTSAVHDRGGRLFIQLMHVGRMSHPDNTPHHRQPVAPSAVASGEKMHTRGGLKETPAPRVLTEDEIRATIADYRHAAVRSIEAGADGVEIHGANGYLIQQFLSPNANMRADAYGGTIANRARFGIEVAAAIADAIGPDRTGIRLSPGSRLGGIVEGDELEALYLHVIGELAGLDIAYVHIAHGGNDALLKRIRAAWPRTLLVNRINRPLAAAVADIDAGLADIAPVGRWALANPDFIERFRRGDVLNAPDPATFYSAGARGYTDYPRLHDNPVAS